jgi:hypothetical protein
VVSGAADGWAVGPERAEVVDFSGTKLRTCKYIWIVMVAGDFGSAASWARWSACLMALLWWDAPLPRVRVAAVFCEFMRLAAVCLAVGISVPD